jgi:hypothetical protein
MGMAHDITNAQHQFQGSIDIPFRRLWFVDLSPHIFQGCSWKQLRGVIRPAVRVESHIEYGQDAGMFQLAGDLGFRQKTIHSGLGSDGLFRQAFHRRAPSQFKIPDPPDVALSTARHSFQDVILFEKIPPGRQAGGGNKISAFVMGFLFKSPGRCIRMCAERPLEKAFGTNGERVIITHLTAAIVAMFHQDISGSVRASTSRQNAPSQLLDSANWCERLLCALRKQGYKIFDFRANFVFIRPDQFANFVPSIAGQPLPEAMMRLFECFLLHSELDSRLRLGDFTP